MPITPTSAPTPPPIFRPLAALALVLVGPLVLGLLIAPTVYNILVVLVRHHPDFAGLHPLDFAKVTNRCMLAVALLLLAPAFRLSGLRAELRAALRGGEGRAAALVAALLVGLSSMVLLYGVGLALGGYRLDMKNELSALFLIEVVAGALFVGVFEELFFRGFVFGALRRRDAFWPAAVLASLFFSAIHFAQPVLRRPHRWTDLNDAFALLRHLFNGFDWMRDGPFALTLFFMGLTLCVLYQRQGHLFWCVGLHAGWVLAMQLGNQLCDRDFDRLTWLFTQSGYVGQGLIALPIMLLFFLWAVSRPDLGAALPRRRPVL